MSEGELLVVATLLLAVTTVILLVGALRRSREDHASANPAPALSAAVQEEVDWFADLSGKSDHDLLSLGEIRLMIIRMRLTMLRHLIENGSAVAGGRVSLAMVDIEAARVQAALDQNTH